MIKELEAELKKVQNTLQGPPEGLREMRRSILNQTSHFNFSAERIIYLVTYSAARPSSH